MIKPLSLFHSDALALLERIEGGTVILGYLDPPFVTPTYFQTDDDIQADKDAKTIDHHTRYLMMATHQIKRILDDNGVVVWHTLPSLAGQIRLILDQVFGRSKFRTEIILRQTSRFFHRKEEMGSNLDQEKRKWGQTLISD